MIRTLLLLLLLGLLLFSVQVHHAAAASLSSWSTTENYNYHLRRSDARMAHHRGDEPKDDVSQQQRRQLQQQQSIVRYYKYLTSQDIQEQLRAWQSRYQNQFVHLTTAQEAYGLPRSGEPGDCPFDDDDDNNNGGCLIYILTVQDFQRHPAGSESSKRLPEVIWNGELHGNERIGPTAVMEATRLLLEAADCQARLLAATASVSSCRDQLLAQGITDQHRRWLARLVATRRIVVMPTPNAVGYYRNQRTELGIDPNRDFPYDVASAKDCMQTIAARAINEVYGRHMFQMGLVFHSGVAVLGYEWGAFPWLRQRAPDEVSQSVVTAELSRYGGSWATSSRNSGADDDDGKAYPIGTMNDMVYAVRGGMEDWSYAGSWDTPHVTVCQPTTYGGYAPERLTHAHPNATLRQFTLLVETSNDKEPALHLGSSLHVLDDPTTTAAASSNNGNGHFARNIRLALRSADLVEPYVWLTQLNGKDISEHTMAPPALPRPVGQSCRQGPQQAQLAVPVDKDGSAAPAHVVEVSWKVGGALQVDQTEIWFGKWDGIPVETLDCLSQPSLSGVANLQQRLQRGTPVGPSTSGDARTTTFSALLNVSAFVPGDELVLLASARVDSSWAQTPPQVAPTVPPQTHLANVRTNPDWFFQSDNNIVQGRLDWFSLPLTVLMISKEEEEEAAAISSTQTPSTSSQQPNDPPNGSPSSSGARYGYGSTTRLVTTLVGGFFLATVLSSFGR